MASKIFRRVNAKQMAMGALVLATVICIPKVGASVSNALAKVRGRLSGSAI